MTTCHRSDGATWQFGLRAFCSDAVAIGGGHLSHLDASLACSGLPARVTDLGHFRLSLDAMGWSISPQFGPLPLRAQVMPLPTQVKATQERKGMWARSRPLERQTMICRVDVAKST